MSSPYIWRFAHQKSKVWRYIHLAERARLEDVFTFPRVKLEDILTCQKSPAWRCTHFTKRAKLKESRCTQTWRHTHLAKLEDVHPQKPYLKRYSPCQKPYLKMYLPYQKNKILKLYLLCQKRHACSCTHLAKRAILVGCQEVLCGLKAVSTLYKHIKIQSNKQSTVQTHQNTVKQTEDCINT